MEAQLSLQIFLLMVHRPIHCLVHLFTVLLFQGSWFAAEQRYIKALDLVPGVNQLLGLKGKMVRGEADLAAVRTASDYSYSASSYAGENYRIVGDAAGKFYCTSNVRF